jgi:hypothetical protein
MLTGMELAVVAAPLAGMLPVFVAIVERLVFPVVCKADVAMLVVFVTRVARLPPASWAAFVGSGRAAADTGCVAWKNVPVTGVVGMVAIETGCVVWKNVPVTA